jgi:hypothetical protein
MLSAQKALPYNTALYIVVYYTMIKVTNQVLPITRFLQNRRSGGLSLPEDE